MTDELSVMRDTLNGLARLLVKSSAEDRPAIMAMIKNAEQSIASMRAKSLTPQQKARQERIDMYLSVFRRANLAIAQEIVEEVEKAVAPTSIDLIFKVTSILMQHVAKLEAGKSGGQFGHLAEKPNGRGQIAHVAEKPNGGSKPRTVLGVQHKEDILQ